MGLYMKHAVMNIWCNRCHKSYGSTQAFEQHLRDSPHHFACPECAFDGWTWDQLLQHFRDDGCRIACRGCNDGGGAHWTSHSNAYWHHVHDENVCTECERHFSSPHNLHQHQLFHRHPTYECYKCKKRCKTYGGMIIHLEYGNCSHIGNTDLNRLAAECRMWNYFIFEDCRDDLLNYGSTKGDLDPFLCPTCQKTFPKLSSLFQHVESSSCEQTLNDNVIGKLRNFLESRLRVI